LVATTVNVRLLPLVRKVTAQLVAVPGGLQVLAAGRGGDGEAGVKALPLAGGSVQETIAILLRGRGDAGRGGGDGHPDHGDDARGRPYCRCRLVFSDDGRVRRDVLSRS